MDKETRLAKLIETREEIGRAEYGLQEMRESMIRQAALINKWLGFADDLARELQVEIEKEGGAS